MKNIPNKYSLEKRKYIIDEYRKGRNTKEIAIELGTYNTTIRRILKGEKIQVRTGTEVRSIVKANLFNILDEDTNYWIGMLATDGCLSHGNRIILQLQEQDKELLEKYAKWIKYPVNINKTYYKQFDKICYSIGFTNTECANSLKQYGITERKSETIEIKIPITRDMLRGIIDGDGSIVSTSNNTGVRVSITTISEKFANQLYTYLIDNKFNPIFTNRIPDQTLTRTSKRQFLISLNKKIDVIRLKEFLYKDANYYLQRKFDKYTRLLSENIVDRVWSRVEIGRKCQKAALKQRMINKAKRLQQD